MTFSEKLYSLRKKSGLSQEQLAERLNVSRQAISKWESGVSVPENDKLIAIGRYFNVTIDYLLKDEVQVPEAASVEAPLQKNRSVRKYLGISFCIVGLLCLLVWGVLMIVAPTAFDAVADSSAVTLDGRGILLIGCCFLVALGVGLLLKNRNRR